MKLALRELRRRPGRFVVATAILTLIALLLMFLGGLLDGLTAGSTGALRAQRGELIVYSADSQDSLVRSRITPAVRADVEEVVGPARVAGLGSVQLGARVEGHGPRDLVPVVLFGYERAPRGLPDAVPRARAGLRRQLAAVRRRHGGRHPPPRSRPVPGRGDRVPGRQPLLGPGHAVGLARHVARRCWRPTARASGWGRASSRR